MNAHVDRSQENKSNAIANSLSKQQSVSKSTFQFVDNRPEVIAQRKLQEAINYSPQVKQLRAYQTMADNYTAQTAQRKENLEEETLQRKLQPIQKKENNTGLPGNLKSGIENLSGFSMDDVKVHYNSDKPSQLQAHAYAQGTDIHLASGQEKHLPHEAWHVVQQKQGRVKPTLQMKGNININDDFGLEKEADVMGSKVSQLVDNGEITQNTKSLSSVTSEPIIQRAVGYEFETGWLVRREISLNNYVPMKKKERIGFSGFDGFKMEADEAAGGEGEIEFIVHPPIEEGESGYKTLEDVMDGLEIFGSVLETKKEPFTLNEITGNPSDKMFRIIPGKGGLSAGAQVTTGLDLSKIKDLKAINDRQDPKSPLYELLHDEKGGKAPGELQGNIEFLSSVASEISEKAETSAELNGLLVVISNYLDTGANWKKGVELNDELKWKLALNYPKMIADRLLARTNFVKLFKLIPKWEQKKYTENPGQFIALIQKILPEYVDVKTDSIIERGIKRSETRPEEGIIIPDLTIEKWLLELLEGNDLIPTKIEDAESLGEFGEKVESVGEDGSLFGSPRDVGIFEFRGAQTNKIHYKRWKPFALEFQKYISTVHRD